MHNILSRLAEVLKPFLEIFRTQNTLKTRIYALCFSETYQRPIRDRHAWSETHWRPRHASSETDMPNRRPIGVLDMLHRRPTCLIWDSLETDMPYRRPTFLISDPLETSTCFSGHWHAWLETHQRPWHSSSETHLKPTCPIKDPLKTDMPHRRPTYMPNLRRIGDQHA